MSFDLKIREGDLHIGSDGSFEIVENSDKLIQEILKIAHTPLGSNIFYPWYGSPISKSLIGNALDIQFVSSIASSQLQASLENLQKLQQQQAREQKVSAAEQLAAIQQISIVRNYVDPRYFSVTIDVITRALTPISTSFNVSPL